MDAAACRDVARAGHHAAGLLPGYCRAIAGLLKAGLSRVVTRIAGMVLRACALVAIVLGILFWTGNAEQLHDVHMTVGILLVLALWTMAIGQASKPGGIGLLLAAIVAGVALAVVGMTQERILPGQNHWIIQVTHLALALVAVGLGEMLAGRAAKARAGAK